MATPAIIIHSIDYTLAENQQLFKQLSLTLDKQKTALIGNNGTGKSTLLKLICGQIQPQGGSISTHGTVAYLQQSPNIKRDDTIADALGIGDKWRAYVAIQHGSTCADDFDRIDNQWDIEQQAQIALKQFNLPNIGLDTPIDHISGGQLTRVQLAKAFLPQYDYLLLDEPSNNLDQSTRELLHNAIKNETRGMLIASHDRELLELMDHTIELSSLGVKHYGGNYNHYQQQKAIETEAAQAALTNRTHLAEAGLSQIQKRKQTHQRAVSKGLKDKKAEIKSKGTYDKMAFKSQQGRSEKTNKKILIQTERKTTALQSELSEAKSQVEQVKRLRVDLIKTSVPNNKVILALDNVNFSYQQHSVIQNCNLILNGPTRLALQGDNGSGKTTLIRLILNQLPPQTGTIYRGVDHIAYLDQHASQLDDSLSVIDNFRQFNPTIDDTNAYRFLDHFLFRNKAAEKIVGCLSGGERLRALLACILMAETPPQLLILDEPTNHLDISSIECIEQAIKAYQGALIVVSHDQQFLQNIGIDEQYQLNPNRQPTP
ncbi:MAG: ABC-F family ATP-binding cassette domain-containing protein [Coxiellaceae bacterium]|nr:ABC-F family ATP-binding cassette domain-containing protein [Coxiellaceae bacterium]